MNKDEEKEQNKVFHLFHLLRANQNNNFFERKDEHKKKSM